MARRVASLAVAVVGAAAVLTAVAAPASATVSATPASWTPQVTSPNATVRQLLKCGSLMFAVGSFTQVKQGGQVYTRHNAFSFNGTTGAMTTWHPNPNGEVNSVGVTVGCVTAILGGAFTSVAGAAVHNLAAVSVSTGAIVSTFGHTTNGVVQTVAVVNAGHDVMVGGGFTNVNGTAKGYYASLDPKTGKVNSYFTAKIAGRLPPDAGGTMVYNQQISPHGDRLLFEGDFTTVNGQPRLQVVELNLSTTSATLNGWHNDTLNSTYCAQNEQFFARDAAFSPDQNTIYIAATGFQGSSPFCDAVTAFTNTTNATVKWSNKTGGDSLYAVAAGPNDVYIGGHERWANNPFGSDSCGPGCVSRPGVGDISASSGQATSWNPTRARGHGADDLVITPYGLWVASDTFFNSTGCGNRYHPGICFFPGTA
jgi:hypothetical protein